MAESWLRLYRHVHCKVHSMSKFFKDKILGVKSLQKAESKVGTKLV